MKSMFATLTALVVLCALGCGSSSHRAVSEANTPHATGTASSTSAATTAVTLVIGHSLKGLRGDEEDDEFESKTEGTVPSGDSDNDQDNDTADNVGKGYYERDDAPVRYYGHAATPVQERALVAVVERYLRAGVDGDGVLACSLLLPSLAGSAVEDYGHGVGPSYLQSAKTCSEVAVGMLRHVSGEVTGSIYVTAVRVGGNRAYVLLGSPSAPARYAILERQARGWRLPELLPEPLP